jgi:mRNA interferase MazF
MLFMTGSNSFQQGDIVLVPFPFTDLTNSKQRPAIVVSANWFNHSHPDVLLAAVTSQIPAERKTDEILLSQADLRMANLPKPGIVRSGKILALEQSLVIRKLGRVSPETRGAVLKAIQQILSEENSSV